MGLIDQGWYLLIIFLIGLLFGLVLEQSGFSSSRKLAGVFYGYDFVVLKVFFTAGITAMSGLVILGYFGWVDLSVLHINSNFLLSAVAGGVIMGFGFILGGFCPGTSLTGAVIGKIDAMVFVAGLFIGVFLFGLFSNQFNTLYSGVYLNRELISDTLGIGKHTMVFVWILMALIAFGVASWFEKRATKGLPPTNVRYVGLGAEVIMALVIGLFIMSLPPVKSNSLFETKAQRVASEAIAEPNTISADEMAFLLIRNPRELQIIDVRDADDYAAFHIPGSFNIPMDVINHRSVQTYYDVPDRRTVLVSNGGVAAGRAQLLLTRAGHQNIYILDGGLNHFVETIFYNNQMPEGTTGQFETSQYKFRQRAARYFLGKEETTTTPRAVPARGTATEPPTTATQPASGGC